MLVLGIDPGQYESAFVIYQPEAPEGPFVVAKYIVPNDVMLFKCCQIEASCLAIEMIEGFGKTVGQSTFETIFWAGRFAQAFKGSLGFEKIGRHAIKMNFCESRKARDSDIREALIHRFGGPAELKKGGKLHGFKSHLWSALAVAVTYCDHEKLEPTPR
jgi:hypothetical protein